MNGVKMRMTWGPKFRGEGAVMSDSYEGWVNLSMCDWSRAIAVASVTIFICWSHSSWSLACFSSLLATAALASASDIRITACTRHAHHNARARAHTHSALHCIITVQLRSEIIDVLLLVAQSCVCIANYITNIFSYIHTHTRARVHTDIHEHTHTSTTCTRDRGIGIMPTSCRPRTSSFQIVLQFPHRSHQLPLVIPRR